MSENPHYAERSDEETTPQTGGGVESEAGDGGGSGSGDDPQVGGISDGPGSHGGEGEHAGHSQHAGTALSGEGAPHPAGNDERSGREVGGPRAAEDAERTEAGEADELPGGAKGDIQTKGMDPHQ
jgi:hypothetical protein